MLDKQGLIPVPFRFSVSDLLNNTTVQVLGYNNSEREFDALITHLTVLAENLNNSIPLHLQVVVTDPDFGTTKTAVWRTSNQDQAAASYYLSGSPSLGVLLRSGGKIYGQGLFAVAHASNKVSISGIGYLIPRMVI